MSYRLCMKCFGIDQTLIIHFILCRKRACNKENAWILHFAGFIIHFACNHYMAIFNFLRLTVVTYSDKPEL